MKNVVVGLLALVSAPVLASMLPFYHAQLDKLQFQPGSDLAQMHFSVATVSVAPQYGNLTLSLNRTIKCVSGKMCPAIAYAPLVYQVPAQTAQEGACHEMIYSGVQDDRANGGELIQITVTDNTLNTCKTYIALPATEVILEIQGGPQNVNEHHILDGARLIEQM